MAAGKSMVRMQAPARTIALIEPFMPSISYLDSSLPGLILKTRKAVLLSSLISST
jgi:hypothetical protein